MTYPQGATTQVLDAWTRGQETFRQLVGAFTENTERATSALRGGTGGPAGLLGPGLLGPGLLGPGGLATPSAVVDQTFDVWVSVLEAQRTIAHGMIDAAGSLLRLPGAASSAD